MQRRDFIKQSVKFTALAGIMPNLILDANAANSSVNLANSGVKATNSNTINSSKNSTNSSVNSANLNKNSANFSKNTTNSASKSTANAQNLGSKVKYTKLNNGAKVALVGFGTYQIHGKECQKCVENAIETGYTLIDTAQMYGNEREVGNALKVALNGTLKREQLFITTKLSSDMSYKEALNAARASIERLQCGYVDLILLHRAYPSSRAMYQALETLHGEGMLKSLGLSNFTPKLYADFIGSCKVLPVMNQMETHVFCQQREIQALMQKQGVKLEAWSPFAKGYGDFFKNATLAKIAAKHGKSVAQVALRYLIERDIIVIPKTTSIARMRENIDIFGFALDENDRKIIAAMDTKEPFFRWF